MIAARHRLLVAAIGVALGCGAKPGQAEQAAAPAQPAIPFAAPKEQHVKAELIVEHASIQPGGRTRVGVHFDIDPGWHIYADPPGDAGMATTVAWSETPGATFGPLQWPAPEEFVDPGDIRTRGYAGSLVLLSDLTLAAHGTLTELPLGAKVTWLACKEICIPGTVQLQQVLPVTQAE